MPVVLTAAGRVLDSGVGWSGPDPGDYTTPMNRDRWALLFACCFPTILTWVYFVVLAGGAGRFQQIAYTTGKTIQFAFPIVWVWLVTRQPLEMRFSGKGMGSAIGFGGLVLAVMLSGWFAGLRELSFFDSPAAEIRAKVFGVGITLPWHFVVLGVFYSLCHSFLEEYYWRWFVFRQVRRNRSLGLSVAVSSIGFMAHHVVVLATYFGWGSPVTWGFSFCVAFGGGVWAWIYDRGDSILAPWISHLLVDAAIFIVGYDMIFLR